LAYPQELPLEFLPLYLELVPHRAVPHASPIESLGQYWLGKSSIGAYPPHLEECHQSTNLFRRSVNRQMPTRNVTTTDPNRTGFGKIDQSKIKQGVSNLTIRFYLILPRPNANRTFL
jgi:hypothetical protein